VRGYLAFLLCIAKAFTTIPTAIELVDLGDALYQYLHIEHKEERESASHGRSMELTRSGSILVVLDDHSHDHNHDHSQYINGLQKVRQEKTVRRR
jgi:hypothetical protein